VTLDTTVQDGTFYHVTTGDALASIFSHGIDPSYSKGKLKVTWLVSRYKIAWAILHVSYSHQAIVDDIYVCRVNVDWGAIKRSNKAGVVYTYDLLPVDDISPAMWFAEGLI